MITDSVGGEVPTIGRVRPFVVSTLFFKLIDL